MQNARLLLSLSLVLPLAACSKGFGSNFEGQVTLHTTRAGGIPQDLVVKAKGDKLRFETTGANGQLGIALFDPQANKVVVVMEAQKAYMDMDFSAPSSAPNTDGKTAAVEKTGKH